MLPRFKTTVTREPGWRAGGALSKARVKKRLARELWTSSSGLVGKKTELSPWPA